MSNKIRFYMTEEVDELLPLLHETYMRIGRFQKKRSPRNEAILVDRLDEIGPRLQAFKGVIQPSKQLYFEVLLRQDLNISDRIIALDTAVGAMHIEFSVPRMYQHQESEALRLALEQARMSEDDVMPMPAKGAQEGAMLCRGMPASPGIANGLVFVLTEETDHTAIPAGCILVATMTRPEVATEFARVNGVVTNTGGQLCHAAIIAREMGVPCVVGTGDATKVLTPGMQVRVDGNSGQVLRL